MDTRRSSSNRPVRALGSTAPDDNKPKFHPPFLCRLLLPAQVGEKLTVRLMPWDAGVEEAMQAVGYNPFLEITCRSAERTGRGMHSVGQRGAACQCAAGRSMRSVGQRGAACTAWTDAACQSSRLGSGLLLPAHLIPAQPARVCPPAPPRSAPCLAMQLQQEPGERAAPPVRQVGARGAGAGVRRQRPGHIHAPAARLPHAAARRQVGRPRLRPPAPGGVGRLSACGCAAVCPSSMGSRACKQGTLSQPSARWLMGGDTGLSRPTAAAPALAAAC